MADQPQVILCVDDELLVLESLMGQLHQHYGDRFVLEATESAEDGEALVAEYLEEGYDFAVIISDWLMPLSKGDQFLLKMNKLLPNTGLIMLSGHADDEAIMRAKKYANLHTFMSKPWDKAELVAAIEDILARREMVIPLKGS